MTDNEVMTIAKIAVIETRLIRTAAAAAIMRKAVENHDRPLMVYGLLEFQEHMTVVDKALNDALDGIIASLPCPPSAIPEPEGMVQ